jgi:VWFA-related protein
MTEMEGTLMIQRLFRQTQYTILGTILIVGYGFAQTWGHHLHLALQNPNPTPLRVTTRLVQVAVIAQDKGGRPVTDLSKDSFTITDQGETQQISSFNRITDRSIITATTEPSEAVFSNRPEQETNGSGAAVVILFDSINTSRGDLQQARDQAARFIEGMNPRDRIALYGVSFKGAFILHDFTNDAQALLRALGFSLPQKTAGPALSAPPASNTGDSTTDAWIDEANSRTAIPAYAQNPGGQTADAMKAIAKILAKLPGRKTLIWITGGFPYLHTSGRTGLALSGVSRAMNDANVAIYSVDARGLIAPIGGIPLPPIDIGSMSVLAKDTGGRVLFNTNDISGSIQQAIGDSNVSYVLSYYPSHNEWDGSFRHVKVTVSRPGISLRYRSGYYATAGGGMDRAQTVSDALRSPLQVADLGLDVHATILEGRGVNELKVDVHVGPGQMRFEQRGTRWTDSVEVVWVEFDEQERLVGRGGTVVNLTPEDSDYRGILHGGFWFTEHINYKDNATELRLVVRDGGSNAIGSLNIPLSRLGKGNLLKPPGE